MKASKRQRRRRILLMADFAYASGKAVASGVIRFASAHAGIDLLLHGRTSEMPLMRRGLVPDSAIDGIVSCIWLDADYLRRLRKAKPPVPIVFASLPRGWSPPKAGPSASIFCDHAAIAGAAADLLVRHGLTDFGYVGSRYEEAARTWNSERREAFQAALAAFGFRVPVAIKCAASSTSVSVYNNLLRDPYKICGGLFLDGIQGGTGAANEVSLDHTGHPIVSKIRDCYLAAVRQGLQGQIPLYGGGGIGLTGNAAADAFKMICLGANGVFCGKILIQLLGCVGNEHGRCNSCNTGKCPTGICTQDPRLVKRLDVDRGAQKIVDYVLAFDSEMKKLMAPIGNSSLPVGRSDALVSTDKAIADKLGIQYVC